MHKGNIHRFLAGVFYLFAMVFVLNVGGFLHGCGEEGTQSTDAEFEVGGIDINICKTNFDCPGGYVCENQKCVKYGGDVLSDTITDVADVKDVSDVFVDAQDVEDVGDGGIEPITVTIYDIQDESSEKHPSVGSYVFVTGVVATSPKFVVSSSSGLNGFFVEEKNGGAYSGILIYGKSDVIGDNLTVNVGDEYDVWGYYKEFKGSNDTYSLSEIEVTQLVLRQNNSKVPDPVKISDPSTIATGGSQSEMYQGVLLELNGVSVTKEADTYGEWTVTGDLLVDDIFYSYKPAVGTKFSKLIGILHTSFNNYKLEPRDEGDIEVEITDAGVDIGVDVIEDTGIVVKEVTIYDIQNTASQNHPAENEPIVVKNVVVTAPTHSASANLYGIFVEEKNGGEYSGILVVYPKSSGLGPYEAGDEITIEGSYKEYNDLSEIVAKNITKIGTATVPAPEVVDPNDITTGGAKAENYEGVLVKIENVEVINANPDTPNDYKEFAVTGGLRVNDLYQYDYTAQRKVGDKFNFIIGVLDYSYSNFKLEPRGNSDLSLIVVGPDAGEDVSDVVEDVVVTDVVTDVVEDVVITDVVTDAGEDVTTDVGEDTGVNPSCENIAKHIVISEVSTRGTGGNDEYVEIYNPTGSVVDMSGWKLLYKQNAGGIWSVKTTLPANTVIKPYGYFLFGSSDSSYSGPARDAQFAAGLADNGHVRLVDASDNIIDTVGFNGGDAAEGTSITNPCSTNPCTKSVERKARSTSTSATMQSGGADELAGNGYDSNNNASDFIVRETRDPKNSQSPVENHGCFDCQPTGDEICDGKDNDCNGLTDAEDPNLKLDCELQAGVCAGAKHTANQCVNGQWIRACDGTEYGANYSANELCDGLDNNCDGQTDETYSNLGSSCSAGVGECLRTGVYVCKSDKSGTECNAVPGQAGTEICNNKDDDCNGQTDEENAQGCTTYYRDEDNDTYGVDGDTKCLCSATVPYTATRGGDCDDSKADINPDITEVCDGIDNDCNGQTDEGEMRQGCSEYYYDNDGDTFYAVNADVKCLCKADATIKYTGVNSGDCDDNNNAVFPGNTEVADGIDNDCDGTTSEAQFSATWGNIQWADKGVPSMTIASAENTGNIYGRVYAAGITDAGGDPGLIKVQLIVAPEDDVMSFKVFGDATHNPLCNGCGNNYEYIIDVNAKDFIVQGNSVYKYAFRYSTDGGANWIYGGYQDKSFKRFEEYDIQYAGTINITGCIPSGSEICDGKDNDCNGLTDAQDPNLKLDCELQQGVCAGAKHTANQCVNGQWTRACDATEYGADYSTTEKCDNLDNNCDGQTDEGENAQGCDTYYMDSDLDTYGVTGDTKCLCSASGLYTATRGGDCVDNDKDINPDAVEVCNLKDDNCDGQTDEGENAQGCDTYYMDSDLDTYGVTGDTKCLCSASGLYTATRGGDCVDNDKDINPDAIEVCNLKDDNCNGQTDEENAQGCTNYYKDLDGDGYGITSDKKCLCSALPSYTATIGGDCNDTNPNVNPSRTEVCNGIDDNCNGQTDEENAQGCTTYYYDNDGDLYYLPGASSKCLCSGDYISKYTGTTAYDCDDNNSDINPSKTEIVGNGVDDDCNGQSDENSTYTIDWCNTQWPYEVYINEGEPTGSIYGQVYVPGLTDAAGDPNLIMAMIAIAPADFASFSEFKFFIASYNATIGNNFEYVANVNWNDFAVQGKYRYVYGFMFSVDGGINWVYGGIDNSFFINWTLFDPAKFGKIITTNHIVISEVSTRGTGGNDEYVEIYNPTLSVVDMSGWKLLYKQNAGGSWSVKTTLPANTVIQPHGYFLFGSTDASYSGPARDAQFTAGLADNGHVRLVDASDNVIDTVGFNGGDSAEGASITNPCSTNPCTKSVERKARSTSTSATMQSGGVDELAGNGYDSDNNANDFIVRDTKQPQNSASPPEP